MFAALVCIFYRVYTFYRRKTTSVMAESGSKVIKQAKDRHNCCVPQCHDVKTEANHMHQAPKDEVERRKWAIAIKTGKSLKRKMTVCSKHFQKTDYIISSKHLTFNNVKS